MEAKIPYPVGLWISNSTPAPEGYCSALDNFIPTKQGLKLRRGNQIIDNTRRYTFLASMARLNSIVAFTDNEILLINNDNKVITPILTKENLDVPINFIEANNRLVFFYANKVPAELYLDETSTWKLDDLVFNVKAPETLDFVNFTGAVRYRERLYYYKEGENKVYYTIPLGYKGELKSFDFTNIFNSRGALKFIATMGYTAGVGVQSHLIIVFELGDILVFDGTNPENPESFKGLSRVSLNTRVYGYPIEVGSNLYCLTEAGVADISSCITTNNNLYAFSLTDSIKDANLDYSRMKLMVFDTFIFLFVSNYAYDYIFNLETGGWAQISSVVVEEAAALGKNFYFIAGNICYQAFSLPYDEVEIIDEGNKIIGKKEITGTYQTTWVDLGTSNNKHLQFVVLDLLEIGGTYTIYASVGSNYNTEYLNKSTLPRQISRVVTWSTIEEKTWSEIERLLWIGERVNAYQNIKFARGALGRTLSARIEVTGEEVQSFVLGNVSLQYKVAGI